MNILKVCLCDSNTIFLYSYYSYKYINKLHNGRCVNCFNHINITINKYYVFRTNQKKNNKNSNTTNVHNICSCNDIFRITLNLLCL